MESIGTIFNRVVKDIGLESARRINSIRKEWSGLVGEVISTHAYPEALKGDMLILVVESPQWMHHLSFYKDEVAIKLERFGVKRVRFRLGRLPSTPTLTPTPKERPLTEDDRRYLDDTLRGIKDGELRKRFQSLLLHGLTKGRRP
jgi:hypothetical protein